MKYVSVIIVLFFAFGGAIIAYSQTIPKIDSLKIQLSQSPPDKINRLYLQIANTFITSKPDSALHYGAMAVDWSKKVHDAITEAEATYVIGFAQYVKGEYHLALEFFLRTKAIYDSLQVDEKLGMAHNNIGLIYMAQNDFPRAISSYTKAISVHEKYKNVPELIKNYYNLGISYQSLNVFDSSHHYFHKSLSMAKNSSNQAFIAKNNMFLGEWHGLQGQVDSAIYHYQTSLALIAPNNSWDLCFAKAGYAKVLLQSGRLEESLVLAKESLDLALELNAIWEMERIYLILSDILLAKKDIEGAFIAFKKHKQFSDSIYNTEREQDIYRLNLANQELENDKLVINNLLQQQKITQKNTTIWLGVGVLLLSLVIVYFLFKGYRQKQKFSEQLLLVNQTIERKNKDLEIVNATKNKMFSVISHDLVGPISTLKMMLGMTRDKSLSKGEFERSIDRLNDSVDKVSFTLTNLLYWAKTQMMGPIKTAKPISIDKIVNESLNLFSDKALASGVATVNNIKSGHMILADENEISLVLRNLIGNALKFTPKGGKIELTAEQLPNNMLKIEIADTGVGMDQLMVDSLFAYHGKPLTQGLHGETGTGLGLIFCHDAIVSHGGTLAVRSTLGQGSTFTFTLPLV